MGDIDLFDIRSRIVESVTELFDTMLDMEIGLAEDQGASMDTGQGLVAGMLSFTGDVLGTFRVQATRPFARLMTAAMLGMDEDEIEGEDEIKDVILEACNIVGGNLKSGFNDGGLACVMSAPAIAMGSSFDIETLNMARYERLLFHHDEHLFLVETCVKPGEDVPTDLIQKLTPIDVTKFKKLDIISTAGDTLIEMFDKMFEMKLEASDSPPDSIKGILQVMGRVDFAGEVTGSTQILTSETLARIITSKMSEKPLEEVKDEEEIKDVVGEMCNIVGGNLKAGFCDSGLSCEISPPTIILGKDFKVENLNMARYEQFTFRFYEHDILIQICAKIDENAEIDQEPQGDVVGDEPEGEASGAVPPIETDDAQPGDETSGEAGKVEPEAPNNIDVILDIPIEISVELGRTSMKIRDVSMLEEGTSIVLSNTEGDPLEIFANGRLIARGEVVVEKGRYGIKITEVVDRMERIKRLG